MNHDKRRDWAAFDAQYQSLKERLKGPAMGSAEESGTSGQESLETLLRSALAVQEAGNELDELIRTCRLDLHSPAARLLAELDTSNQLPDVPTLEILGLMLHDLILDGELTSQDSLTADVLRRMACCGERALQYLPYAVACLLAPGATPLVKDAALTFMLVTHDHDVCLNPLGEVLRLCGDPDLAAWEATHRDEEDEPEEPEGPSWMSDSPDPMSE